MPRRPDNRSALADSLAHSIRRDRSAFSAERARREAGEAREDETAAAANATPPVTERSARE